MKLIVRKGYFLPGSTLTLALGLAPVGVAFWPDIRPDVWPDVLAPLAFPADAPANERLKVMGILRRLGWAVCVTFLCAVWPETKDFSSLWKHFEWKNWSNHYTDWGSTPKLTRNKTNNLENNKVTVPTILHWLHLSVIFYKNVTCTLLHLYQQ